VYINGHRHVVGDSVIEQTPEGFMVTSEIFDSGVKDLIADNTITGFSVGVSVKSFKGGYPGSRDIPAGTLVHVQSMLNLDANKWHKHVETINTRLGEDEPAQDRPALEQRSGSDAELQPGR
jgi:hypothetical protein